jgi:RND family efflux transporter MFP subunit
VDGKIVAISPSLVSGGFFAQGDVLLEIEPLDYRTRLAKARAFLDRSTSDLDNAQKNHKRQERLLARGAVSDAHLDDAFNRLKIAEATLQEAKANLSQAERDLARTKIMAPFDGRVRSERVDVGQFVRRGDQVGTIYATDYAEVRLPIHDDELAFLDIPLLHHDQELATYPDVTLSANFAGDRRQWQGQVVRTEGELDPETRMIHVVARVADPYGNAGGQSGAIAPLSIGLFVDAEIHGRTEANVTVLPRTALRDDNQLLIVDRENKLRFRQVEVLRVNGSNVYVGKGVAPGDRVCLSAMQSSMEGMLVRVVGQEVSNSQQAADSGP